MDQHEEQNKQIFMTYIW